MNTTTNYNLPQWEAKDRVTRESVNDAMSSIDGALAAGASPWVKVAEATLDADAEPATFTFDAFDASDYALLLLVPEIRSTSGNDRLGFFLNGRNGRVNTDGEFGNAACSTRPIGSLTFITPVGGYLSSYTVLIGVENTSTFQSLRYSYNETNVISSIEATSNTGTVQAGSRIRIYGLKK